MTLNKVVGAKMQSNEYLPILRKTGAVLVVIGICDLALIIYSLARATSYASSLYICALIAGFFLIRGNLRAASFIHSLAIFGLVLFSGMLVLSLCLRPISLTITQLLVQPKAIVIPTVSVLGLLVLLYWLQSQLRQKPIKAALLNQRLPRPTLRTPVLAGALGLFLATFLMGSLLNGESAQKAKDLAREDLGDAYQYHVSSISVSKSSSRKDVSSVVMAWTDREVKQLSIEWQE